MEAKEVKKWQDEEALKRYGMIVPLLDPESVRGWNGQGAAHRAALQSVTSPFSAENGDRGDTAVLSFRL